MRVTRQLAAIGILACVLSVPLGTQQGPNPDRLSVRAIRPLTLLEPPSPRNSPEPQSAASTAASQRIAFTGARSGDRDRPAPDSALVDVYTVDEDGRQLRKLTLSPGLYSSLSWSPDRRSLAVALRRGADQGIYLLSVDRPTVPRRILTGVAGDQGFAPAWSPDGKALAFTAIVDGNADVYVVGADGSGLRRLTDDPAIDVSPTWSPTGAFIAFVSDRGGKPNVYTVSAAGGTPRALSDQFCDSPAWSVLDEIACASLTPRGMAIKIVKALVPESKPTEIAMGHRPTFSPDGQRIAFIGPGSDLGDISTARRDGSGIQRITSGGRHRYLAWAE